MLTNCLDIFFRFYFQPFLLFSSKIQIIYKIYVCSVNAHKCVYYALQASVSAFLRNCTLMRIQTVRGLQTGSEILDTGTACGVQLGFSCMSADDWLQITQVAVYALQGLLREYLYRMMSQLCEAVQIYSARQVTIIIS